MVAAMTEARNAEGAGGKKPEKMERTSLNVSRETAQLVGKIAAMRGKSVGEFFQEPDIAELLKHLLLAEMKKEEKRLQGRK